MDPRRQSHQAAQAEGATHHSSGMPDDSRLPVRILIILLIVVSLCGVAVFGVKALNAVTADSSVKSKQFQAVFLTNGQVYFGKLSHVNQGYVKLTDIFYLQVNNASSSQPSTGSSSSTSVQPSSSSNQQVSLAKLGSELHGPEDVMYITRSQVLFWENLKDSGKVVQAIDKYQAANK